MAPAAFLSACGDAAQPSEKKGDSTAVVKATDTVTFTVNNISEEVYCQQAAVYGYCNDGESDSDSSEVQGDPDSLNEVALIKTHGNILSRKGEMLEVSTAKGKKQFKTKQDPTGVSENIAEYRASAVYKNLVTISGEYYESHNYIVVDLETGEEFYTWGEPVLNSDETKIISGNTDLEANYTENGLQLFVKRNGSWQLVMEKILDDWGPEDLLWKDNETVFCKKVFPMQPDSDGLIKFDYVKVVLKEEKMD